MLKLPLSKILIRWILCSLVYLPEVKTKLGFVLIMYNISNTNIIFIKKKNGGW